MNNKFFKLLLLVLISIFFIGCSDKDKETIDMLKKENQQLIIQVKQLKEKIQKLEKKINEPKKLILQAKEYIKEKNGNEAKNILLEIIKKYPSEKNNKEIKSLLIESEKLIKQKKLQEKQLMAELKKIMTIDKDDIENIIWYLPKKLEICPYDDSVFYAYIGQDGDTKKPWLRIFIKYVGNEWLFINKFVIVTDDNKYVYEKDFKRKVLNDGHIEEWVDFYANDRDIKMLHDLAKTKHFKIRFYGNDSYEDLSSGCLSIGISTLSDTLKVYNVLMKKYKSNNIY